VPLYIFFVLYDVTCYASDIYTLQEDSFTEQALRRSFFASLFKSFYSAIHSDILKLCKLYFINFYKKILKINRKKKNMNNVIADAYAEGNKIKNIIFA
jgi:hypothetical protein